MKIKMLKTTSGSVNGIKVQKFQKDEVYELEGDLLDVFLKIKVAEPVEGVKMVTPPENKAVQPKKEEEKKEDKKFKKKEDK